MATLMRLAVEIESQERQVARLEDSLAVARRRLKRLRNAMRLAIREAGHAVFDGDRIYRLNEAGFLAIEAGSYASAVEIPDEAIDGADDSGEWSPDDRVALGPAPESEPESESSPVPIAALEDIEAELDRPTPEPALEDWPA